MINLAKQLVKSIPGVTEAIVEYKIHQQNATEVYHSVKNLALRAIIEIENIKNNPHIKVGFGIKTIDQWCQDIRFAKMMIINIDQGRTLPALHEGPNSVKYKEFAKLMDNYALNVVCGFIKVKGGKNYKLKGTRNSNIQHQSRISKKYKSKKIFRKSKKRLGK